MHRNNIEDQDQVVVVFIRYTKIRSLTANDLCKFSHEQKKNDEWEEEENNYN